MQIRACRDCGEEYRPDAPVSECSDCGGPIETRDEAKGAPESERESDDDAHETGDMAARVCLDCGEEYRLDADVTVCADCGGRIGTPPKSQPEPPVRSAEGPYEDLYHGDRAADLDPLAERLGRAGVPYRVRTTRNGFELLIPIAEAAHARQLLPEWFPPEPHEEPVDAEAGPGRCPACDTEIPAETHDCPECGLLVGAVESDDDCPACGAEFASDQGACPSCGHH